MTQEFTAGNGKANLAESPDNITEASSVQELLAACAEGKHHRPRDELRNESKEPAKIMYVCSHERLSQQQ